uniref:Uncharacterized protein n=1 Tax=Arundo donax TaxID=35708 RepID=A0A0A8YX87_ARUDO
MLECRRSLVVIIYQPL